MKKSTHTGGISLSARGSLAELLDEGLDLGLKGESRWFRADVCSGIELKEGKPSIDRESGVIYGYSVITEGPALGHGASVDATTLQQVADLGNKAKIGIKARFDHPNASNTSLGTFLGRSKHFRLAGNRVLADLHLNDAAKEAPQGDLYSYVLNLAESDPQAFGASIVFEGTFEEQLNEDGTRKIDAQGKPLPRLTRITSLLASDIVDEPAANAGGLFSQSESLASKVTEFLNRWAEHSLMPRLQALMTHHKEEIAMATELKEVTAADVDKARTEGFASGQKAERERVEAIHKSFAAVWGDKAPESELKVRDGLVELGTSAADCETKFKERKLTQITNSAPSSAGGGGETRTEKVDLSNLSLEDRCKAEYANTPALREEFLSVGSYIAFERNKGNIKIKSTKE